MLTNVLWDFARLVGRYRGMPDRLYDLAENLEACELTLEMWRRKWGVIARQPSKTYRIENENSKVLTSVGLYYEILWSKKGWQNIQRCLGALTGISQYLDIVTSQLVRTAMRYRHDGKRSFFEHDFDSVLVRKTITDIRGRVPTGRRFFWAATYKMDDLDKQIERFEKKLVTLERFSDYYLNLAHPDLWNDDPKQRQANAKRLLEDQSREQLLKDARKLRSGANMLWDVSRDLQGTRVHLGIAGLQAASPNDAAVVLDPSSRTLRLLLEDGQQTAEWNARRKHSSSPSRHANEPVVSTISDALHQISKDRKHARLVPPDNRHRGELLSLRRTRHSKLQELLKEQPLSKFIGPRSTSFTTGTAPTLSIRDIRAIAAALADGSFRLLGTPWMAYLDATNIRGSRAAALVGNSSAASSDSEDDSSTNGTWLAMLVPETGNETINSALRELQRIHTRRNITEHAQLFRLGVILAELAVGCTVSYASASVDARSPGVGIVLPEISDDEPLDAIDVAGAVEADFGRAYADLVQFCLAAVSDAEMFRLTELDRVVLPKMLEP